MNVNPPDGWERVRLSDICHIEMGQSPPSSTYNETGDGLPFFQGKAEFTKLFPIARKWCVDPKKIAYENDILLSVRAPVGPTNLASSKCCIGRGLAALSPYSGVKNRFVLYALRLFQTDMDRMGTGTTFKAVSGSVVRDFPFLIAPTNEQHHIVAKIEELFSELDAGISALERVQANLKRYRASVLKAAVEGKLTEQWRAEHPDVEPAGEVLKRILTERRKKWEEDQLAKYESKGKKPPKNWKEKYKTPIQPDKKRTWQTSNGWFWVTIDAITFVTKLAGFEYTKYVKYDPDGDLVVIKAENAGKYGFKRTDFSRIKSETIKDLNRSRLYGGEILMVFVGAGVGKVAMVPIDQSYFLGPNIGMIRIESSVMEPKFVELFLRSPRGYQLALSFTKAVAQPSLSMNTIRQIPICIPQLEEQKQIIESVDEKISIIEQVESEVRTNLKKAICLRQAILKRAFEGRLVPQDPNDEPASVVLERIKSERKKIEKANQLSKIKRQRKRVNHGN